MAINFVRQPSETPNVRNIDDIIPFRYAYGNQNGYVKDKGNELSYTLNGSNFRINSGRVVLQGVESDIDANGVTITVDNVATTRYYSIYYRVNLATNTTSIESEFSTTDYPEIDPGDDLTANTSGSANLELYRFTALNGIISNVEKVVEEIVYTEKALKGYDATKGTIEERLTNLGFKQGSITLESGFTAQNNKVTRQGNYVLGNVALYNNALGSGSMSLVKIGTLSEEFRPKNDNAFAIIRPCTPVTGASYYSQIESQVIFYTNGDVRVSFTSSNANWSSTGVCYIKFGYEANPIE